jgi:ATP-dependent DNA helicase RecG
MDDFPDQLTAAEFFTIVGTVEHEQLDFKRGVPDDIRSAIPAMAMTDGGIVVHGVNDRREITGCPLSQNTLDRIMRYSHECGVEVQVREISVDGTKLTLVAVPEIRGRIVTTPDGRLLRRVGGDSQPLVGDALARFVREREERSAEDEVLPTFDPDDLELSLVNAALRADGRPPVRRASLERAMVDLGVALPPSPPLGPQVLRAAVLLFGRDPRVYVPGAVVQLVRRTGVGPGPGPTAARIELGGPIVALLDSCLEFIGDHTRKFEVVVGARRETLHEYPPEVLREALLNAFAHRDYSLVGATVDVTIWDDRIEIRSPGPLPGHITVDNMRDEHYSRNRRMMRVLKLIGLVEEYGEGVDRMIREMEARLMEPPIFSATPSSVTVTLRNRYLVEVEDQVWLALLGHYQLSPPERLALVVAHREGSVTRRRLRELLPSSEVEELLSGAVAKGLFVRVGEKGGSRYVLSDEVVLRAGSQGLEAQSRKRQLLLDEINRRGSISTAEGAAILDEDMATVRHLLNDLVRGGLARAEGRTRARRYYGG